MPIKGRRGPQTVLKTDPSTHRVTEDAMVESSRHNSRLSPGHGAFTALPQYIPSGKSARNMCEEELHTDKDPPNFPVEAHHLSLKASTSIRRTRYNLHPNPDTSLDACDDYEVTAQSPSIHKWLLQHFTPLEWTHPTAILGFCITFMIMIATLVVILRLSDIREGFAVPKLSSPFVWRYVPTAIFTIIISLWRQVDYAAKTSAPWLDLAKGHRTANRTYLLDYVSPILPSALYLAAKNKHWRVVSTIVIFGTLKIIVVFSTGLLTFQNIRLSVHNYPVTLRSLSGSTNRGVHSEFYMQEVFGNLAENLPYQPGTSETAAFQELSAVNVFPSQAVVTTEVKAFFPDLLCEDAIVNFYWTNTTDIINFPNGTTLKQSFTDAQSDFESSTCTGTMTLGIELYCDLSKWDCASDNVYLAFKRTVHCPTSGTLSDTDSQPNAFVIATLAFAPDPTPGARIKNAPFLSWSTAAVCRPTYAVESARLTLDTGATEPSRMKSLSNPITSTQQMITNYSVSDLTQDIDTLFSSTLYGVTSILPATSEQANYSEVDSWFQLMLYDLSSTQIEVFQNTTAFKRSATLVFKRLATQWVASWLSFPDHLLTSASYVYEEERLYVQRQVTWQMCAGLAVATLIGMALFVTSTKAATFKIPKSLSALAALLTSNLGIEQVLTGTGIFSDDRLSDHLQPLNFSLEGVWVNSPMCQFTETVDDVLTTKAQQLPTKSAKHQSWIPMSSTKWFAAICICIPACEVIVLEVLQRQSDQHQGFCDVTTSSDIGHQLITILSALVMVSTAALFSATEWAVGVFAPYNRLKNRVCRLTQVDDNDFGGLAPVALLKATKHRQFAVSAMLVASIIGGVLTITVSGLFSISSSSKIYDITAYSTSQFNPAWNDTSNSATVNTFSLIYEHNASEPDGTYQEIAFPSVRLDQSNKNLARILASRNATDSVIDISMPVLRGLLNCSIIPQEDISYGVKAAKYSASLAVSPTSNVNATFDLPEQCRFSRDRYQNSSRLLATYSNNIALSVNDSWIDGQIMDVNGLGATARKVPVYSWPQYCPSLGFIVGQFANDTSPANKTVLICTQLQEEIPARVRFKVPSLFRDTRTPIELDESQARVVTGYQYYFQGLSQTPYFYTTLANTTGIQLDELIDAKDVQKLINATQHLYRLYMAQAFNAAMRTTNTTRNTTSVTADTLPLNSILNGTIFDVTGLRIVQNNKSKIILQSFLSAMIVCYITAYAMIDMRTTLPHNPCTIAGAMSLLAGSQFAEEAHSIAQQNGDMNEPGKQLADSRLRMGWFTGKEDDSPRFGIDFDD